MTAAVIPIIPAIELKRILYATDFSEGSQAALPIVSALARRYHSEVFVSHIWSPAPYPMVTPEVLAAQDEQEHIANHKVAEILNITHAQNIVSRPIVRAGNPVEELERIVHEKSIDLAVLSTHGRVGMSHLMMGLRGRGILPQRGLPGADRGTTSRSALQDYYRN